MVTVDESHWPILAILFPGPLSEDDVDVYNGALERAIASGEPFGAAMVSTPEYLFAPPNNAVSNKSMKWLKQHKPALSTTCCGIAMIVHDEQHRSAMAPKVAMQGEKVYGCPLGLFGSLEEAQVWLYAQIADRSRETATASRAAGL